MYSSEANTDAIDKRFTPGLGMNENVKVAMSNSLAGAFEMPVPAEDLKFCGVALGKKPGVIGACVALPVLMMIPLAMPRLEPVDVKVPATLALPPLFNTAVPVNVIPGFAAAMAEAKVAAFVVLVTVTAASAKDAKVKALNSSTPKLTTQPQSLANVSFDFKRTAKP